jgi:hypothetical protein
MRIAAVLVACLAGCSIATGGGSECHDDSQCGDDVCARSGECMPRSSVRQLAVRWTVNGVAADPTSCANLPLLYLEFEGADYGDTLRFTQVVCSTGLHTIDKLPKRYLRVELGFEGTAGDTTAIDAASTQVQFDLFQ